MIEATEIKNRIFEIISEHLGIPKEELNLQSDLVKDYNVQRLEIADLFLSIEDEFQITLPQEKVDEISTIEDLIELVNDNLL